MFWKSKTKEEPKATSNSTALVRQDPRTSVKTESAQSETTNTSVQNATIFNNNTKTVTYQTTRQTVTHQQQARVTEILTRRTPTPAELEEMLRTLSFSKTETTSSSNAANRRSLGRGTSQNGLPAIMAKPSSGGGGGISAKSTPKFKSTTQTTRPVSQLIINYDSPAASGGGFAAAGVGSSSGSSTSGGSAYRSKTGATPAPPLVKIKSTTVTQKNGRTVTSHTEQQRIKIKLDASAFKLSTPNSPLSNFSSTTTNRIDARPLAIGNKPSGTTTTTTTYTSPYLQRTIFTPPQPNTRSYTSAYSAANGAVAKKPATTTTTTTKVVTTTAPAAAAKPSYFSGIRSSGSRPASTISTASVASSASSTSSPFAREFTSAAAAAKPAAPTSATSNAKLAAKSKPKSSLKPGHAYIFNNEQFDNPNNEYRVGSSEDVKLLRKTFDSFKLKVTVIENATLDKIASTVQKIELKDYTNHSSLVIVILTHGSRHDEVAAKDGAYSIDDKILFPILRNRTLIDKPKMFFIQACKGAMEIGGFHRDSVQPHGSPNEILKCYSTFEGYVSYRTDKGSLFVQALCENLRLSGNTRNIKDIMEAVTLSVKRESLNKQIPSITSTLTKPYVFGDYA